MFAYFIFRNKKILVLALIALVIQIKEITLMLGDVQDLTSEMDDDDGNFWEMHVIVFGDGSEFKPRATCVQQFTSKGLCSHVPHSDLFLMHNAN